MKHLSQRTVFSNLMDEIIVRFKGKEDNERDSIGALSIVLYRSRRLDIIKTFIAATRKQAFFTALG